jgi:hypothetical protein
MINNNEYISSIDKERRPPSMTELPAVVPVEVDAKSTALFELGADNEKLYRPELPTSTSHDYPADVKAPIERPQNQRTPESHTREAHPVSPTSPMSSNDIESPVSPIIERK